MTYAMTPSDADVEDTSVEPADTAGAPVSSAEPQTDADGAEADVKPEETLIFGKYKSLEEAEKGYKEAEKAITRSAELEKKLKAYQENEQKALTEREGKAKAMGFNDAEEQQLDFNVKSFEFDRYVQALETTLTGDEYTKAYQALARYQTTLNPKDLLDAKACFSPDVIAKIAENTAIYKQQAYQEYEANKKVRQMGEINQVLSEFAKESGDWLNPKERQDIVGLAINLTGGAVDLHKLKSYVDALEAMAIKQFQEKAKATAENQTLQDSLQTPSESGGVGMSEHWFTKEEYQKMTPDEENANYDKIVRQIELEKQGKIPRMLT